MRRRELLTTALPAVLAPTVLTRSASATGVDWGSPALVEDFSGASIDESRWNVYGDYAGHDGNGMRLVRQCRVSNGTLRIDGDAAGNTGGMALRRGQRYGRWEVRLRTWQDSSAHAAYHPVALLWPDSEQWPEGGEYDFFETDCGAPDTHCFLHHMRNGTHEKTEEATTVDIAQWHTYTFEWTPTSLAGWVDGQPWYERTEPELQAPGPMHLCLQLDNFGGDVHDVGHLEVDSVRIWNHPG